MTATSYVTLDNDDLGANKIFRAATASALDTNPRSIAQRGTGAPWLNGVGALEIITTGSGNWTVPAGVYRIKSSAVGGGGGGGNGSGSSGTSGGNTTFGALTANGGSGGSNSGALSYGGAASGGDVNISGGTGGAGLVSFPGASLFGSGLGCGSGGYGHSGGAGGGGGGVSIGVISVEPGDLIAYSVGSAGAAGGGSAIDGIGGIIIIEY